MTRRRLVLVGLGLVLAAVAGLVVQKERLLHSGRRVLLELQPRDPSSLIEGDYMALWYRVSNDLYRLGGTGELPKKGRLVFRLDEADRGAFVRVDDGTPLGPDEVLVRFRHADGSVRVAADAFYFQQGQAKEFERARWGELRVTPAGEALLVGLCDGALAPLGR